MTNLGSTVRDGDALPRDFIEGNVKQKAATVAGVAVENQILQQKMENLHEQMRRLIGLYQGLHNEFEQFKKQRVIELQARVNGGPTAPDADD